MSDYSHKDFACILSIIESIDKIQDYIQSYDNPDDFYNDAKSFDAVMMNFIN